ncbi:MAG TPA: Fic family protein [Smithellaceae bacterium]|nr:Fic family protein [Smithellaceae bacterium]
MKPPYEITHKIVYLYGQITEALGMCKSLLLEKPDAKLRRQNRIKTIHSSLAIEGNTLNLDHVTAIMDHKHVIGPRKDIIEVQNAVKAYEQLTRFHPFSVSDFLKAHQILMRGLVEQAGHFRTKQVGIINGDEVRHVAPGYDKVPDLMRGLFDYLQNDSDLDIIKSCVFHYEVEFIHPFEDGNGRMGRYWHTRLLMKVNPLFEYVPVEEAIKNHQAAYYDALAKSDRAGMSTMFVEFMLEVINQSLRQTIDESRALNVNFQKRTEYALSKLNDWFDRKEYMKINKGISTATASRDLKQLLEKGIILSSGEGRMMKYMKK